LRSVRRRLRSGRRLLDGDEHAQRHLPRTGGQTLSTNLGGSGSFAAAKVHNDVRLELVKADADLLCGTLNGTLVKWLTMYNVPGATPPKVWRDCSEQEDLKARADRDKIIFDMGFEPDEQYINDTYGGKWRKKAATAVNGEPKTVNEGNSPAQFAEGDDAQTAIDDFAAAFSAEELQRQVATVIKPVMARLDKTGDYAEAMEAMSKAYPDMKTDTLQDLLARMIFISETWGRINGAV
jgi:phage gp29-like protein